MEADHADPAAGPEHSHGRGERGLERGELVVHGNAERLEDALRGVAVAEPRGSRDRLLDGVDELAGALEGLLGAAPDDRAGDLLREALLPVAAEDAHELG